MELGKYKLAMRPKKYLTREFVVYKAAPEAMDDVITEEQNTIDTMPSQAPAMDNYMPEFPGMEDPSLRQVELADGGVVQREGFKDGINYTRNPMKVMGEVTDMQGAAVYLSSEASDYATGMDLVIDGGYLAW